MGIRSKKIEAHWAYFLSLEADLQELSRYIEFAQPNFDTYGTEVARVLIAAAAEAEVVCRQICATVSPAKNANNIHDFRDCITAVYSDFSAFEVIAPRYGLELHPWDEWQKPGGVPYWWTAYNKTKHHRHNEFKRANIHNAINAVAGLYVAALYLYREKAMAGALLPAAAILQPGRRHYGGLTMGDYELGVNYILN